MANDPFFLVIIAACIGVAVVLVWGVSMFGRGADSKQTNKVMQLRIVAQFAAVVLIVGFALFRARGG